MPKVARQPPLPVTCKGLAAVCIIKTKNMKTIDNHFKGRKTYIIGKLIVNGCQSFQIDKLDAVCREFEVPEQMKNEVRELYYKNGEVENWEELAKHEDRKIREAVATQGHCLNTLVNDKSWRVKRQVARQGYMAWIN